MIKLRELPQTQDEPVRLELSTPKHSNIVYPYPSNARNLQEAINIVLTKFYDECGWVKPKNGFLLNSFGVGENYATEAW